MLNAAASSRNDAGRYVVNAPAKSENQKIIRNSAPDNWIPYYIVTDADGDVTDEGTLFDCDRASHPEEFSGLNMLSVITVDLLDGLEVTDSTGLLATGDTIYSSATSLYVATQNWDTWLTHQSINTYFVHLDKRRIKKQIPQPKFKRGNSAVIRTVIQLLDEARAFTASIIQHQDFPGLDTYGRRYWAEFQSALKQLHHQMTTSRSSQRGR